MCYMSSRCGSDGTMTITVTFKVGTDLDIAAVNVQNRVAIAQAKLPQDVIRQGLTIPKQSPDLVEIVALIYPDGSRDELYLANYATLQVVDVVARVPGVGQVTVFNGRDYGMRLWLNPERLAGLGLTAGDVADGVGEQTLQAAGGQIGQPPALPGQQFQYTVTTRGRLSTPAEFEEIILRTRSDGSLLRVRDVARVELGAQSYGSFGRVGGKPAALVGIFQLPGANALEVSKGVQAAVARLAPSFPSGVTHTRPYNTTEFVRVSIEEVVQTLLIAILLVVLTVYVFLQDWRATLTPALCALLLRPGGSARKRWLARVWNAAFLRLTSGYDRTVQHIVRRSALAVVVLLALSGAGYFLLRTVPTGFAHTEDQGYLLVNVQLPDAASLERTDAVVRQIEKILLETSGVETVVAIGGAGLLPPGAGAPARAPPSPPP